MKHCYSCTAPLSGDFAGPAQNYCKYCSDEGGDLKPREEVRQGIAQWFMEWQPDLDREKALARADLFMRALPAWADD